MNSSFNLCKMKKITIVFAVVFAQMFFGQRKMLALEINWPEEYEWEVVDKLDKDSIYVRKIIPKGENEKNPSITCQALAIKPPDIYKADFAIKKLKGLPEELTEELPPIKTTVLEKKEESDGFWELSKIENKYHYDYRQDIFQIYSELIYIRQKGNIIYRIYVLVKEKSLSEEFVKKWSKVFKESRLVNE